MKNKKKIILSLALSSIALGSIATSFIIAKENHQRTKNNNVVEKVTTNANAHEVTIRFTAGNTGATITGTTVFKLKKGKQFFYIKDRPQATKYQQMFAGWALSSAPTVIIAENYKFTSDTTLVPVFDNISLANYYSINTNGDIIAWNADELFDTAKTTIHGYNYTTSSSVDSARTSFNYPMSFGSNITSIPNNFLIGCTSFNSEITINSRIKSIGNNFLKGCTSYKTKLVLPSTLTTSVGTGFLNGCTSFYGQNNLEVNCNPDIFAASDETLASTNSEASSYKTGVGVTGTYRTEFIAKFPASSSTNYRNYSVPETIELQLTKVILYKPEAGSSLTDDKQRSTASIKGVDTSKIIYNSLTYTSSDPQTARVDSITGEIYAPGEYTGEVSIEVELYLLNGEKRTATANVKVITISKFAHADESGVTYSYDNLSKTSTKDTISVTNFETGLTEEVPRSQFNKPIEIGSEVTILEDNFLSGCSSFNSPITFTNSATSKLEEIGDNFLQGATSFNQNIKFPNGITKIGTNFMQDNASFSGTITIPTSLTDIGDSFMENCSSFNSSISLPSGLSTIGESFLAGCTSFNQDITIPSAVTSIGSFFMWNCDAFVSTLTLSMPYLDTVFSDASPENTLSSENESKATSTFKVVVKDETEQTAFTTRFPVSTASAPFRKYSISY